MAKSTITPLKISLVVQSESEEMLLPRQDCTVLIHVQDGDERPRHEPIAWILGQRFSVALANELQVLGLQPETISIRATTKGGELDSGSFPARIELNVSAKIRNATQQQFIDATLAAKSKCFLDLSIVPKILIDAQLEKA